MLLLPPNTCHLARALSLAVLLVIHIGICLVIFIAPFATVSHPELSYNADAPGTQPPHNSLLASIRIRRVHPPPIVVPVLPVAVLPSVSLQRVACPLARPVSGARAIQRWCKSPRAPTCKSL